jgi:hypothetical protein
MGNSQNLISSHRFANCWWGIVRIFVLGLPTIMALQNLGVELLPLIAGLGVAGAGVASAMPRSAGKQDGRTDHHFYKSILHWRIYLNRRRRRSG